MCILRRFLKLDIEEACLCAVVVHSTVLQLQLRALFFLSETLQILGGILTQDDDDEELLQHQLCPGWAIIVHYYYQNYLKRLQLI